MGHVSFSNTEPIKMRHNGGKVNKGSKCCADPSKEEYQVTLPYTKTYMYQVILYSHHPGVVPFPDFVVSLSRGSYTYIADLCKNDI